MCGIKFKPNMILRISSCCVNKLDSDKNYPFTMTPNTQQKLRGGVEDAKVKSL